MPYFTAAGFCSALLPHPVVDPLSPPLFKMGVALFAKGSRRPLLQSGELIQVLGGLFWGFHLCAARVPPKPEESRSFPFIDGPLIVWAGAELDALPAPRFPRHPVRFPPRSDPRDLQPVSTNRVFFPSPRQSPIGSVQPPLPPRNSL